MNKLMAMVALLCAGQVLSGSASVERFNVDFTCQNSAAVMKELRQGAVADAIQKANEYAKGFGVVVTGLECVREGTELDSASTPTAVRYLATVDDVMNGALMPDSDFARLTPQQIKFACSISATFIAKSK